MESVYLPVNLLIIKVCFRFLTFGSVQAKYLWCEVRVAGRWILDVRYRQLLAGCVRYREEGQI